MSTAKLTTLQQGATPVLVAHYGDDKPGASEGAECRVLYSAFYPVLTEEKWIFHDGMWVFAPPGGVLL